MTRPFRLPWRRDGGAPAARPDADAAAMERVRSALSGAPDPAPAPAAGPAADRAGDTSAPPAPPPAQAGAAGTAPPALPWRTRLRRGWEPWRPLRPFLLATLLPVPLLVLAATAGGAWSLLALLWMTLFVHVADEVAKGRGAPGPDPRAAAAADRLSVLLAGAHFLLLPLAAWALAGGAGIGLFDGLAAFLAFGLWFGQVSNANAHELIHRADRRLHRLGVAVFVSLLFGHHASAHRLVHHRFVATPDDPNTAEAGESFYAFAARAWPGSFVAGYEMEQNRRAKAGLRGLRAVNPYLAYVGGAVLCLLLVLVSFGPDGLLAYLLLCGHAQLQLLLTDYVQHYGLRRRELPSGGLEPVGPRHSWDAPHRVSGLMMLNAARHADHHAHPARPYPGLRLRPPAETPRLPHSLPVMAAMALIPPLWHRTMDRRLAAFAARAGT